MNCRVQRHDGAGLAGYGLRLRLSRPTGARNAAKAEVGEQRHWERGVKTTPPHCIMRGRNSTTIKIGKQEINWTRRSAAGHEKAVQVISHVRERVRSTVGRRSGLFDVEKVGPCRLNRRADMSEQPVVLGAACLVMAHGSREPRTRLPLPRSLSLLFSSPTDTSPTRAIAVSVLLV